MKSLNFKTFFLVFICTLSSSSFSQKLSVGTQGSWKDLSHPLLPKNEQDLMLNSFLLLPIISFEKNWEWKCQLCTELPTLENRGLSFFTDEKGKKKLSIHLELRSKLSWGDGLPVTSKDLAYTWELVQKLPEESLLYEKLRWIEDIFIQEESSPFFTITLSKITDPYPILNAFSILSSHVGKDQNLENILGNSYLSNPSNPGLYNGPFLFKNSQRTSSQLSLLKLIRNPYSLFSSGIKTLELEIHSQTHSLLEKLRQKSLQAILYLKTSKENIEILKQMSSQSFYSVHYEDDWDFEHIDFNLENPIFRNENLRQALAHALDKDEIIKNFTKNTSIPTQSPIHPADPYLFRELHLYDYSPKKAQELLESAQWSFESPKSKYRTRRGSMLSFELLSVQDPIRIQTAKYLAKAWGKIGAHVQLKFLPLSQFRKTISKRHFSGMALYSWHLLPFANLTGLFNSSEIPERNSQYSGQNLPGWINTKVDSNLRSFYENIESSKKQKALEVFQEEYTKELPSLPLFYRTSLNFVTKDIQNYSLAPLPSNLGLSIAKWNFLPRKDSPTSLR